MESVLHPKKSVKLREGEVTVSELKWPALFELLNKLSSHAKAFVNDKGQFAFRPDEINLIITGSEDLMQYLLLSSTGKDKEWLSKLSMSEAVDVLDAALEVNLNDTLISRVKKIGSRLQGLFPAQPARTPSAR